MKEEEEIVDYSVYSLVELQEIIGNMENKIPNDKRTKERKDYLKVINSIFDIYNKKVGWKVYKKFKS